MPKKPKPARVDPKVRALLAGLGDLRHGLRGTFTRAVCRSKLRAHVVAYLDDPTIADGDWDQLTQGQRELLNEACNEALTNEAPAVAEYEVTEDFGPYPVFIRGVPGVYFLSAIERDPIGPFATLKQARDGLELNFAEFIPAGTAKKK